MQSKNVAGSIKWWCSSLVNANSWQTRKKSAASKYVRMKDTIAVVNTAVGSRSDRNWKPLHTKLGFRQNNESYFEYGILEATTTLSANGLASGILHVKNTDSNVNIRSNLSFETKIYTSEVADKVASSRESMKTKKMWFSQHKEIMPYILRYGRDCCNRLQLW